MYGVQLCDIFARKQKIVKGSIGMDTRLPICRLNGENKNTSIEAKRCIEYDRNQLLFVEMPLDIVDFLQV